MEERRVASLVIGVFILQAASFWCVGRVEGQLLSVDFYNKTCPNVETIVLDVAKRKAQQSQIAAPATLRLFFHDCWVQGCDGSVLLASTAGNTAEKDAEPNLTLAGDAFDVVIQAKQELERQCPGVVSCADILAIAARDLTGLVGGPKWNVEKGRRDGRVSLASEAAAQLPGENFNLDQLVSSFSSKGLSRDDLVALSGAHSIGFSHCTAITKRLYSFSGTTPTDPSMDPAFASDLKQSCPSSGGDPGLVLPLDVTTNFQFDKAYYQNLVHGRGLLFSDQVLFNDARTKALVRAFSKRTPKFYAAFVTAINKMGAVGVLTGAQGEIRRDCSRVN